MSSDASHRDSEEAQAHHPGHGTVWIATVLNGLVPGLGLAYLGRWSLAAANFMIATIVVIGCFAANDTTIMEHVHWVFLVLIVGSAAIAHGIAKSSS